MHSSHLLSYEHLKHPELHKNIFPLLVRTPELDPSGGLCEASLSNVYLTMIWSTFLYSERSTGLFYLFNSKTEFFHLLASSLDIFFEKINFASVLFFGNWKTYYLF